MPLYTYEDPETGLKIDLRRSVEDRNKPIVLQRIKTVPDRVGVLVPGATEESSFNARMLKEHHKKEEREGSRFRSAFKKEQIKKAWAN
jgi:hypothetical protein